MVGRSKRPSKQPHHLALHAEYRGSEWNNFIRPIQSVCQSHACAWQNGGSPSMCRRAPRCSSLSPLGASRNPDQYNSLGSRSTGSIPPAIFGWHLKHGLPDRFISIRWEVSGTDSRSFGTSPKPEKWSLHQEWSPAVQAPHRPMTDYACLIWSPTAYCCLSGKCRCFSPSVFALLTMQLVTLVTSKKFDSKLADVGNPLITQLGRYLRWSRDDPGPLKQGARNRQLVLATRKRRTCRHNESCLQALFDYLDRIFPWFFLNCKANARV